MPYKDPERRREYNRRYQKRYYAKNKAKRRSEVSARRKGIRKWFEDLRRESQCAVCGLQGADCPWLLDFHHLDPSTKQNTVSYLVNNGYSKERILVEIEKCEVLCANHHRQHHWENRHEAENSLDIAANRDRSPEARNAATARKLEQKVNRARAVARLPEGHRMPGPKPTDEEE